MSIIQPASIAKATNEQTKSFGFYLQRCGDTNVDTIHERLEFVSVRIINWAICSCDHKTRKGQKHLFAYIHTVISFEIVDYTIQSIELLQTARVWSLIPHPTCRLHSAEMYRDEYIKANKHWFNIRYFLYYCYCFTVAPVSLFTSHFNSLARFRSGFQRFGYALRHDRSSHSNRYHGSTRPFQFRFFTSLSLILSLSLLYTVDVHRLFLLGVCLTVFFLTLNWYWHWQWITKILDFAKEHSNSTKCW